ncbi:hypothetical protein B9T12_08840 [Wohlfahrtiimonas chitiniclastica]|uniref:rhodanese-like domain-containing protein n=1 Tax=Wohlfahrtiimonas chitiniclastica TaxID=400946 RepID=UPI000B9970F2|nr:rhodanese-like domain-containing protein [Wohlfahrtiimonas chitiniclastica]OYQ77242.1 hypothetical protein B9T12_08840 [Wohlfahrtiimonas chitiniclastica]
MTFLEFFRAELIWFAGLTIVFVLIILNELKSIKTKAFLISSVKALQLSNDDQAVFVDIRNADAYKRAHIPSAVHMPVDQLSTKVTTSSALKNKVIVLYCDSASASTAAVEKLRKEHPDVSLFSLQGGINAWTQANLPVESSKK